MKKVLLFLSLLLLNSCSLNSLIPIEQVNKLQTIKYSPYMKHYRGYFARTDLQPIKNRKKYRFFYNKKEKDLAVLLQRKNKYILYSMFNSDKKAIEIKKNSKTRYRHIAKILKRKGYHYTLPSSIGCTSNVGLRLYKGVKTLLIEVKDYSYLQNIYKESIRSYNATKIKKIKTRLPKSLISSYYKHYEKRAKTKTQFKQLQIIASKLQLKYRGTKTKTNIEAKTEKIQKKESIKEATKEPIMEDSEEEAAEIIIIEEPKEKSKPYIYYLKEASYEELNDYLYASKINNDFSYDQYNKLKSRCSRLKEDELLKNGSLEDLIVAYKKNKDRRYKKRIMTLMKEVQEKE